MGWEGRQFWQMNMSSDAGQLLPKPWNNDDGSETKTATFVFFQAPLIKESNIKI